MRLGIIGTGFIGKVNTRALLHCPDVEIVGVANRTVEKAEAMCREFALTCPVYGDWREMIRVVKPEVVVICLYNDQHKECFLECARAGIHILVEKPVANTYEDCLEMIAAARENGIKVSVLQTQRYGSVLQTAKEYIDTHKEELGELVCVTDQQNCNYFWEGRSPWHLDPVRSGGGIVLNYGVHQLDRIHWLTGQKSVRIHGCCLTKKPGIATISSYTMMGVTDKGIPYTAVSNGYSGPWINDVCLVFQNGAVKCVLSNNGLAEAGVYTGNTETGNFYPIPLTCRDGEGNCEMYVRQMQEAMAYLTGRVSQSPVPLEWGAEMVRLCCLALRDAGYEGA